MNASDFFQALKKDETEENPETPKKEKKAE